MNLMLLCAALALGRLEECLGEPGGSQHRDSSDSSLALLGGLRAS